MTYCDARRCRVLDWRQEGALEEKWWHKNDGKGHRRQGQQHGKDNFDEKEQPRGRWKDAHQIDAPREREVEVSTLDVRTADIDDTCWISKKKHCEGQDRRGKGSGSQCLASQTAVVARRSCPARQTWSSAWVLERSSRLVTRAT